MSAGHVVLLGDSIFDNKAYVGGDPDVVAQLRGELPSGWRATLLAVDGDVTSGVARQLAALPEDATHLAVSVGGNDALGYAYLLQEQAGSVAGALALLGQAQDRFAAAYAAMIEAVSATGLPAAVCTIYDTPPSEPNHKVIKTAAALFNDHITRAAFARGTWLIDLRLICDEDADYANPIEPSAHGGRKIAQAIAAFVSGDDGARYSRVIGATRRPTG
ncbi:SGNH/GDSL hydrolase family protein [Arthrobacter mobilis]|uniref:SGNH/GDSL hydrolase family protein n=1 Tax=Arthrobacter mobilis TaxID=2724944 RepID=A0A7X6K750_9MICC|nr:SGNH/GDSL hydrolase family protein [Arthrobacter mobilis]NKX56379.1 SGNH/GDSL hydrolase family protein [Arthrobacter mobilis]